MILCAVPGRVIAEVTDVMEDDEFSYLCDMVRELSEMPEEARNALMVAESGEHTSVDDEADFGLVQKGGGVIGADGREKDTKYFMHIRTDFYARMMRAGVFDRLVACGYNDIDRVKVLLFEMQRVFEGVYARVREKVIWLDERIRLGDPNFADLQLGEHSLVDLFDRFALFHTLRIVMYTGHRPDTDVAAKEHKDRGGLTFHIRDTGGGLHVNGVPWDKSRDQTGESVVAVWLGHQAECFQVGPALSHSVVGVEVPRFAAIFFVVFMANEDYRPLYHAWQRLLELMACDHRSA